MILARHPQFIDADTLATMYQELMTTPKWVFRNKFWRYYLIDGLAPYSESDESTWYGNQPAMKNLTEPWRNLFNQVYDLAGPNFKLMRYALTGQTQSQEQELHLDTSKDLTGDFRSYLFYLNTQWDQSWGGATDFCVNNQITHSEYPEPGKLVVFDSQSQHVGHAPNKPQFLRLSMVLHGRL